MSDFFRRQSMTSDGTPYEQVLPGDWVSYQNRMYQVSSAHWMDGDGMQVASIVSGETYLRVRACNLKIIQDNEQGIAASMRQAWNHLDGKVLEAKMNELGFGDLGDGK